jgi:membrane-associated phospholipid phosphatase
MTESKPLKYTATFISVVFHPLLLPTYAFLFLNWVYPYLLFNLDVISKTRLFVTIFINTFLFPVIALFIMRKLDFISSFQMHERQERIIPYIAISFFYFWSYLVVKNLGIGSLINDIMFGASLSVFFVFFFNGFFKISAHAAAAGAFFGLTMFLAFNSIYNLELPLIAVIIIAGLIGSSRLYLSAHTPFEIISGFLAGILGQVISFKFL